MQTTNATGSSKMGNTANDAIGSGGSGGVIPLLNGNYVVRSPAWDNDNGATPDAGAATWGDGTMGVRGAVSAANSLVGSTGNDQVGVRIQPLANGNYVVGSELWDNGAVEDVGAVTWANGATGVRGVI